MTFDQIATLIKHDFTQEQIKTVISLFPETPATPETPSATPGAAPAATTGTNENATPAAAPETPPPAPSAADGTKPPESETLAILREMMGMMQKGNIGGLNQPQNKPDDAGAVLAAIINPVNPAIK